MYHLRLYIHHFYSFSFYLLTSLFFMRVTFLMFFYYTDLMGYFFRLINRDFNTLWRLPRKRRAVIVYCQLAVLYLAYTKPVYLSVLKFICTPMGCGWKLTVYNTHTSSLQRVWLTLLYCMNERAAQGSIFNSSSNRS